MPKFDYIVELTNGREFRFIKNKTRPAIFDDCWGIKDNNGVVTIIPLHQIYCVTRLKSKRRKVGK